MALLLACGAAGVRAQDREEPAAEEPAAPDLRRGEAARADTVPPVTPVGALVRSLVIPGWGQTSVGRPVRGGIYFAAQSMTVLMVFQSQAKLRAARAAEPPDPQLVASRTAQRENWIVLAGFWAFLSGLDAWVSTHFWDFEPAVRPPEDGSAGVELRISVPLGGP